VHFQLTSASVMNSFFIPQLGSQIYTMAGMDTQLSLLASEAGDYAGISANYSGGGFSDMKFTARAMTEGEFADWVRTVHASKQALTMAAYRQLAQPTEKTPVTYYGDVEPGIYHDVLNKCSDGSRCTDDAMKLTMAKNAHGDIALCTLDKPKGL
jgi:cytochrome o ubiquinol oxidase subunit 2